MSEIFIFLTDPTRQLGEMFTGIVERVGTVVSKEASPNSTRLVIDLGEKVDDTIVIGESIASNGCCLTVVCIENNKVSFDLLRETERLTNLGDLEAGSQVNLERSLRADGRLSGHFVTGHVDAVGIIKKWERVGKDYELVVSYPPEFGCYLVPKGCIALDGMSLTVVEVSPESFSIWIIPHTLEVTCLNQRTVGSKVNLEFDLLAKYTRKMITGPKSEL